MYESSVPFCTNKYCPLYFAYRVCYIDATVNLQNKLNDILLISIICLVESI